jgi:hypothetical protein
MHRRFWGDREIVTGHGIGVGLVSSSVSEARLLTSAAPRSRENRNFQADASHARLAIK